MNKQAVYRVGWHHNKWLVVMPEDFCPKTLDCREVIPAIIKEMQRKHERPITFLDHVEYLGEG